ncbi:MAG: hypothetical protein DRO39_07670 [Thermoprotei archaeon]|nr:MAG: hypothetical protein DRO39_07670 [Thermoprotei archaeon]
MAEVKPAIALNITALPLIGAACGAIAYNSIAGIGLGLIYGLFLELVLLFGAVPILGQIFSWYVWMPVIKGWITNLSGMDFSNSVWLIADYIAIAMSILVSIIIPLCIYLSEKA